MRRNSADFDQKQQIKKNTLDHYIQTLGKQDKMGLQNRTLDEVLALVSNRKQLLASEIQQLSTLKLLVQLCNKYACKLLKQGRNEKALDLLECAKELLSSPKIVKDSQLDRFKQVLYNNLSIYCHQIDNYDLSVKFLKNAMQHDKEVPRVVRAGCFNNMASLYMKRSLNEKALKFSNGAILIAEEDIYSKIRAAGTEHEKLKADAEFMNELQVLLVSYLLSGKCAIELSKNPESAYRKKNVQRTEFYNNGESLSKKFNGTQHPLTLKFQKLLQKGESLRLKEPSSATLSRSIDKNSRISELLEVNEKVSSDNESERLSAQNTRNVMSPLVIRKRSQNYMIKSSVSSSIFKKTRQDSQDPEDADTENSFRNTPKIIKVSRKAPIRTKTSFSESSADEHEERRIEKTLQVILSSQKELEQKLAEKIDEKMRISQKSEEDSQARKLRELQIQVELLKKENDIALTSKLEKELEIEKIQLNHRRMSETQLLAMQGVYPAFHGGPSYMPFPNYHRVLPTYSHSFGHSDQQHMFTTLDLNHSIKSNPIPQMHQALSNQYHIHSRSVDQGSNATNAEFQLENNNYKNQNSSVSIKEDNISTASNFEFKSKNVSVDKSDTFFNSQILQNTSMKIGQDVAKFKEESSNLDLHNELQHSSPSITHQNKNEQSSLPVLERFSVEKPIYKADTFGSAGLLSLMNELKKSKVAAPTQSQVELTETIASQISKQENLESPIDSKNTSEHTPHIFNIEKDNVAQFATFTTATEREKSVEAGKIITSIGHFSPTHEVYEYQEYSGTHKGSKDSSDGMHIEKRKGPDFDRKDSIRSIQQEHKNNFSISKMDFDFGEDSIDLKLRTKKHNTSLSIYNGHDDILESPKPCDLIGNNDIFPLPQNSTITKTCFEFSATEVFKIECILDRTIASDMKMKINILKKSLKEESSSYSLFTNEVVSLKNLRNVLRLVEYLDILPLTVSLKSIKNYADFIKYCVIPFVWVIPNDENGPPCQLRAKSKGLLDENTTRNFLGQECIIGLHYLSQNDFRVVLTESAMGTNFRIEVNLDDQSFNKYFEKFSEQPTTNHSNFLLNTLNVLEDEDANAEELKEIVATIEKLESKDTIVNEEIRSCKFKSQTEERLFFDCLSDCLQEIESFFKEKGFDAYAKLASGSPIKFAKLRFWQEGKKKNLSLLVEDQEASKYNIYQKDLFESYAPQGQKIKAEGKTTYPFECFWKDFGVHYSKIDIEDRISFCSLISDCYKLETHEKPIDEEDEESYEPNPIVRIPIDNGCYSRTFKGEVFKFPVTYTFIGVRGYPAGVRATVFDSDKCIESGIFLFIDPSSWKKAPKQLKPGEKKKRTPKYVGLPMVEEYNLTQILKSYGFKLLEDYITFNLDPKNISIVGVRSMKGYSNVDQLENAVTIQSVVKYLKEHTDLFEGLL